MSDVLMNTTTVIMGCYKIYWFKMFVLIKVYFNKIENTATILCIMRRTKKLNYVLIA